MSLRLHSAARSDVGLVRQGNEDSGYAGAHLLVVADGMGGHAAGELASATAVATMADIEVAAPEASDVLAELAGAIDVTGAAIRNVVDEHPTFNGMGTTISAVYWMGERIAVAHVGDSRAYLLRGGELSQLTHDHTLVQSLVDEGRITEAEAAVHPRRSIILRALDGFTPVEPDLSVRESRIGDRYLLCSDGLSGVMSNDEIAALLREGDPTGAVTRLVDLALERGAPDNVTVVVADVMDDDADEDVTPVVVGAAGEPRVRDQLPEVRFPSDHQPDGERMHATAVQPKAREAAAPRPSRRPLVIALSTVAVAVLVVAFAVGIARTWLNAQWYVAVNGAAGTGTVAIYNGVPGTLAGFDLATVASDSHQAVGTLPLFDQELVSKGIPAASLADAQRIVSELQTRANACQGLLPPAGCPGAPQ